MTTRRSRPPRSRKSNTTQSDVPRDDVLVENVERIEAKYPSDAPPMPPSLADELALLDAGWDAV